jgi:hypothetical protein
MNLKHPLYYFFLCLTIACCNSPSTSNTHDHLKSSHSIKELLNHPFGTLLKLSVQIIDGDSSDSKGLAGSFVFRVDGINGIAFSDPIIMEFQDETDKFPNNVIELSKYLYSDDRGTSSFDAEIEMKKKYVGKQFNIIAYETGAFLGVPDDYFKYQPIRQDVGFGFKNYLIVIADLTNLN